MLTEPEPEIKRVDIMMQTEVEVPTPVAEIETQTNSAKLEDRYIQTMKTTLLDTHVQTVETTTCHAEVQTDEVSLLWVTYRLRDGCNVGMQIRKGKANRSVKVMSILNYPIFRKTLSFFIRVLQVQAFGNYLGKIYECMEVNVVLLQKMWNWHF